jgi:hypothetical protein
MDLDLDRSHVSSDQGHRGGRGVHVRNVCDDVTLF